MITTIKKFNEKEDGRDVTIDFITNDTDCRCKIIEGYRVIYWGRKNNQLYIKRFDTESEAFKFANKVLKE